MQIAKLGWGTFLFVKQCTISTQQWRHLNIAKVIDAVISSAAEAELGVLFINAREAVYLRRILVKMGHSQPKTPIQTDNSTAEGFINSKIQPKCTKSMDMRFKWLKDREAKDQFRFYRRLGKTNLAIILQSTIRLHIIEV
jgi:hypothetical protein